MTLTRIIVWMPMWLICLMALGCLPWGRGRLHSPSEVTSWTHDRLVLSNGRTIVLPDVDALPDTSAFLSHAAQRGVEVMPNGRVVGLMTVHSGAGMKGT